jgi:hypothetical protein
LVASSRPASFSSRVRRNGRDPADALDDASNSSCNERAPRFFDQNQEFNMMKKFDYIAAALAGFITTGVLLVSLPAHAQSVAAPAAVVAKTNR